MRQILNQAHRSSAHGSMTCRAQHCAEVTWCWHNIAKLPFMGVSQAGIALCLISLLALLSPFAHANTTTLSATVDRSVIFETDTITYELVGETALDPGFGGLLSFGKRQVSEPEIPGLEDDFEVLDRRQQMNMQTVNGVTQSRLLWRYTLAPRKSGQLLIPAASYGGAQAGAISITVKTGSAPKDSSAPPLVFLEVETDKTSVYVQEQIQFTVRLFSAGNLVAGDLSEPAAPDAIIESVGETKVYYRMAHNQRYEVRERNYLIFPQQSGTLSIDGLSFTGTVIDSRKRRRTRVREISESLDITIKPPPATYSGDHWLPAASLMLSEEWDQDPDTIKVGDALTRHIETRVLGLLASALPPLPALESPLLKVYPDQPQTDSRPHDMGVEALRRETAAYVAVAPGELALPEVRITWWDTVNDVQREAILPARTITITGDATRQTASDDAAATENIAAAPPAPSTPLAEPQAEQLETGANHFWYALVSLLLLGWISTTVLLLRRQRQSLPQPPTQPGNPTEETAWKNLQAALKEQDADLARYVIAWLQSMPAQPGNSREWRSISDIAAIDDTLYQLLKDLEASRFAAAENVSGAPNETDQLRTRLKALRQQLKQNDRGTHRAFYPNGSM